MGTAPSRFYGVCASRRRPASTRRCSACRRAGVRPYRGIGARWRRAASSRCRMGIHGIPVTMEQSVYDSLGAGALANYNTFGLDNRDRYYYRRVYLGCVRANDFLTSLPELGR